MKTLFSKSALLCLLISPYSIRAQVCQEVKLTNDKERLLIHQYIDECRQNRYFVDDKGVVMLTQSTDAQGRRVWYLSAAIDDRYKDNPPTKWASFNGEITLIYDADKPSSGLTDAQRKELLDCLQEVIKDRLYIRPPSQEVWFNVEERPGVPVLNALTGKPLRIKRRRIIGGNAHNDKKIIFNSDGTHTILVPV